MAYQVIARKYRPQRFSDVVGQEHVTRTLSQAIAQKRIAHAYLFCGPRGTGKTTIARIFAKCLNATGGPKVDFAENDPLCVEITEGRSLDVLEIDAASNRGIEEIRGLRESVRYAPAVCRYKLYIIDEVHMLTKEAFNALLKTLEEPPEHVKFLFATTEPEKVLITILSRCQRFDLRRIPLALIVKHLHMIAAKENVSIDAPACHAIARGAEGAMRDAESTLDQLISFCGENIVEQDVLSMFGLSSQGQVWDLAGAVLRGSPEEALRQFNSLAENGKDLGRLLSDLLEHFRNLLLHVLSGGKGTLLEVSESESAALREQAGGATVPVLTRILETLGTAEMRLPSAASKKILIEVALLRCIEAKSSVSIDSVLEKLSQLKERGNSGGTEVARISSAASALTPTNPPPRAAVQPSCATKAASEQSARAVEGEQSTPAGDQVKAAAMNTAVAEASATVPAPAQTQSTAPAPLFPAGCAELPAIESLWADLLESVGKVKRTQRSTLEHAHPMGLTGQTFTIGFAPDAQGSMDLVDQKLVEAKLGELVRPGLRLKCVKLTEVPAPAQQRAQAEAAVPAPVKPAQEQPAAPAPPPPGAKLATAKAEPQAVKTPPAVRLTKEDFLNDPLIRSALEMFKGQIVEIKHRNAEN